MDSQSNRSLQIGNICLQWSNLEYRLALVIWLMVRVNAAVGKIITASLDARGRANMAHSIAHEINAPRYLKFAIKKVQTAINDGLMDERNQAVHGIHLHPLSGAAVIEMHRGKGGRKPRIQLDDGLASTGIKIFQIATEFDIAMARYARELLGSEADGAEGLHAIDAIFAKMRATTADADTSSQSQ